MIFSCSNLGKSFSGETLFSGGTFRIEDKEKAEKLIKELEEVMAKDDTEEINKKKDELQEIAMALATKVYQEAAAKEQAESAESTDEEKEDKDDNVKDAEFEEK